MLTPKIAARCCNGIGQASGLKVEKGLLFDGINIPSDYLVVHKTIKGAIAVFTNSTYASLSRRNETAVTAQGA